MSPPGPTLMKGLLEAFILQSLEEEPKHGYALLKQMGDRFGEEPNRNKIYPLLTRFEDDGLIRAIQEEDGGRGKTVYALTDAGRDVLGAYRNMPDAYQEAIDRLWGRNASAPATPLDARRAPPAPSDLAPDPSPGNRPYPCEDARTHLQKDPRTGNLTVHLTGCPMGAYDYCPQCPMYKALNGFRRLTFG